MRMGALRNSLGYRCNFPAVRAPSFFLSKSGIMKIPSPSSGCDRQQRCVEDELLAKNSKSAGLALDTRLQNMTLIE